MHAEVKIILLPVNLKLYNLVKILKNYLNILLIFSLRTRTLIEDHIHTAEGVLSL